VHVLLAQPIARNVGVLVYDGYDGVKSESNKMHGILSQVCNFAMQQHKELGQFLLVLNFSLLMANGKDKALHLDRLREKLPGIQLTMDNFHEYQSEGKRTKMMLCRIGFGFHITTP
jgi:DNA invertase Pin-like site-specific DNA recombinase